MKTPTVSVLTTVYNGAKYLAEMMDSILAQTLADFEFIIINDGSSDATEAVVKSYHDPRIRYFANDQNRGIAYSTNRAIDLAKGEFLAIADSDDVHHPQRLKIQVGFLRENKNVGMVSGGMKNFSGDTPVFKRIYKPVRQRVRSEMLKHEVLFAPWSGWHPLVMYRASVLATHDIKYPEKYPLALDMAVMLKLSTLTSMAQLTCTLLHYRVHQSNHSFAPDAQNEGARLYRDFYKRKFDLDIDGKAIFYPHLSATTTTMTIERIIAHLRDHPNYKAELLEQAARRALGRAQAQTEAKLVKSRAKITRRHSECKQMLWLVAGLFLAIGVVIGYWLGHNG